MKKTNSDTRDLAITIPLGNVYGRTLIGAYSSTVLLSQHRDSSTECEEKQQAVDLRTE